MAEVFFFLAAIGAIAGAVGTVTAAQPVLHRARAGLPPALAGGAVPAAARGVRRRGAGVVYAGAVMVLYVFVVAYVGGQDEPLLDRHAGAGLRIASALFAGALFVELSSRCSARA